MPSASDKTERRIVRKFYDRFMSELEVFLKSIGGVSDEEARRSYATATLNRLMFVSLLGANGFIERDYLRARLIESEGRGKDRFYRDVILPLFFEGFIRRYEERSSPAQKNLGRVPYLN